MRVSVEHLLTGLVLLATVACSKEQERPVILLSEPVTLGPKPLEITPEKPPPAPGPTNWLIVYLPSGTECSDLPLDKEGRPTPLHAVATTSDGRRYNMEPNPCCDWTGCFSNSIYLTAKLETLTEPRLQHVELWASTPTRITQVKWNWSAFEFDPA